LVAFLLLKVLIKVAGELLTGLLAKSTLQKPGGFLACCASETECGDLGLPLGRNEDFDCLAQMTPPTWMVSLTVPSSSGCSSTVCPLRRASSEAFSMA